ncbi:unnamed protein product [Caenorhabditis nigoni]
MKPLHQRRRKDPPPPPEWTLYGPSDDEKDDVENQNVENLPSLVRNKNKKAGHYRRYASMLNDVTTMPYMQQARELFSIPIDDIGDEKVLPAVKNKKDEIRATFALPVLFYSEHSGQSFRDLDFIKEYNERAGQPEAVEILKNKFYKISIARMLQLMFGHYTLNTKSCDHIPFHVKMEFSKAVRITAHSSRIHCKFHFDLKDSTVLPAMLQMHQGLTDPHIFDEIFGPNFHQLLIPHNININDPDKDRDSWNSDYKAFKLRVGQGLLTLKMISTHLGECSSCFLHFFNTESETFLEKLLNFLCSGATGVALFLDYKDFNDGGRIRSSNFADKIPAQLCRVPKSQRTTKALEFDWKASARSLLPVQARLPTNPAVPSPGSPELPANLSPPISTDDEDVETGEAVSSSKKVMNKVEKNKKAEKHKKSDLPQEGEVPDPAAPPAPNKTPRALKKVAVPEKENDGERGRRRTARATRKQTVALEDPTTFSKQVMNKVEKNKKAEKHKKSDLPEEGEYFAAGNGLDDFPTNLEIQIQASHVEDEAPTQETMKINETKNDARNVSYNIEEDHECTATTKTTEETDGNGEHQKDNQEINKETTLVEPKREELDEDIKKEPIDEIPVELEPKQEVLDAEIKEEPIEYIEREDFLQQKYNGPIDYDDLDRQENLYPGYPQNSKPKTSIRTQKRQHSSTMISGKRMKKENKSSAATSSANP